MSTINITRARSNLYKIVADVNTGYDPVTIVNNRGKNAVIISEDDWRNIQETLALTSIPGLAKKIQKIRQTEDWSKAKKFDANEQW